MSLYIEIHQIPFCFDLNLPVSSSSQGKTKPEDLTTARWNQSLAEWIPKFAATHSDITAILFSSHATITSIFQNPAAYGFKPHNINKKYGAVWYDNIHPTSEVHGIIANDMAKFLNAVACQPTRDEY